MNKIDLIIDALEIALPIKSEYTPDIYKILLARHYKALTAAKQLKELHPVGEFAYDAENNVWEELVPTVTGTKLYALDEV